MNNILDFVKAKVEKELMAASAVMGKFENPKVVFYDSNGKPVSNGMVLVDGVEYKLSKGGEPSVSIPGGYNSFKLFDNQNKILWELRNQQYKKKKRKL